MRVLCVSRRQDAGSVSVSESASERGPRGGRWHRALKRALRKRSSGVTLTAGFFLVTLPPIAPGSRLLSPRKNSARSAPKEPEDRVPIPATLPPLVTQGGR